MSDTPREPADHLGTTRVVLAADSPILAQGLAEHLALHAAIDEVVVAREPSSLAALVRDRDAVVVVFQPRFFGDVDPVDIAAGLARCDRIRSIALVATAGPRLHEDLVGVGSAGTFALARSTDQLARAIIEVSRGATLAFDEALAGPAQAKTRALGLSTREVEVLELLVAGRTNRAIADALFISPHTARHHVQAVLEKLGVHSRVEAAAVAVRDGLVVRVR